MKYINIDKNVAIIRIEIMILNASSFRLVKIKYQFQWFGNKI